MKKLLTILVLLSTATFGQYSVGFKSGFGFTNASGERVVTTLNRTPTIGVDFRLKLTDNIFFESEINYSKFDHKMIQNMNRIYSNEYVFIPIKIGVKPNSNVYPFATFGLNFGKLIKSDLANTSKLEGSWLIACGVGYDVNRFQFIASCEYKSSLFLSNYRANIGYFTTLGVNFKL